MRYHKMTVDKRNRIGASIFTGVVEDLRARRTATVNARDGGAIRVRNHLKVCNGPDFLKP